MENPKMDERSEFKYLIPIAGAFIATLLIANTTAVKLFQLGPAVFPAGIILFPISYIFGDILTEVYGYGRARRIIWTGLAANLLMIATYFIVIKLPAPPFWQFPPTPQGVDPIDQQRALEVILGPVPRIAIGSILAYPAGEFVNSIVLAKMKLWTKGRHLWSRTIGSTVAGQAADTLVFITIAFAGSVPMTRYFQMIISFYIFKVLYEIIATPLTYIIVGFLKKAEHFDYYDRDTQFNPFRWKV